MMTKIGPPRRVDDPPMASNDDGTNKQTLGLQLPMMGHGP
jgi:hypothetical protein